MLTGSRPTNLQPAPDQTETQELKTAENKTVGEVLVARLQVGGQTIGCLGSGELLLGPFHFSADQLCESELGYPAIETAAGLAEALEAGPYGAGVQVSGPEDIGEGTFQVTTPGRWAPGQLSAVPITYKPPVGVNEFVLGATSSKVTSAGSGRLTVTLTNLGNAPLVASGEDPLVITDSLPAHVVPYGVLSEAGGQGTAGPVACAIALSGLLECSYEGSLPPYEAIELEVLVALDDGASDGEAGQVSVAGGDAPSPLPTTQPVHVSPDPVTFGLEYFSMTAEEEGGGEAAAAGSHPFQLTTTIVADSGPETGATRSSARVAQPALPRNLRFTLPAGLVGNVTRVPACPIAVFLQQAQNSPEKLANECPDETAIGVSSVTVRSDNLKGLVRLAVPVFNLPPGRGEPARFGLMVAGDPVVIDTSVDPEDSYRITAEVHNISQVVQFLASTTTLWGVPGSPAHDASRGWNCSYIGASLIPGVCPEHPEDAQIPLLRLPVSCAAPLGFDAGFEPWNVPVGSLIARSSFQSPALGACNQVPFDPQISDALTSKLASNPSGLDLGIQMPNSGLENPAPGAISEAQFKRAEVSFPRGVTVNPSAAEGLAVCSKADYARERYDSAPGEGCPEASKIGSVQIRTPLLEEEATGAVYQATPYDNETESLLGLYLIARVPERGVLVKQPIEVRPDPQTGQLVSIARNVPQLPFSSFSFHFREGGRSPLITPPGCGSFTTTARFTPWSANDPDNPAPSEVIERRATFTIDHGVDGGGCPQGQAPFNPGFQAGTENNQAGTYSTFQMHLTRGDGEQDMGRFSFVLPPGVVPRLAGIPYCSDAQIAQAASRQGPHGGREERDGPSCPAASQIGRTVAGAGVGSQLTYVPGALYLAGPYHGDPISAVSITPALAGPFDAGVVVVREALRLNPLTHVGEVDGSASDPIPHILKGIPLNLRDLRVYADRPEFTLNPTSCEPFKALSTIWGDGTALEPLAPHPVELSSRFQAAGCASLGFKPKLNLRLKGGTRRGAFPALRAAYVPRKHNQANLSRLALTFPSSEFIEQGHFRTICTRVQFAAGPGFGARCPKGSIYGQVKVWTPLLDEPLKGPVYLRSSNHNLPDAVFALHGLVDIEVATRIDSTHGRLRATVAGAPDAPVSRAVVQMQGGQKGLFVNSRNLCHKAKRNRARVNARGQNGRKNLTRPPMRALGCAKRRHKAHRGHARRGA